MANVIGIVVAVVCNDFGYAEGHYIGWLDETLRVIYRWFKVSSLKKVAKGILCIAFI